MSIHRRDFRRSLLAGRQVTGSWLFGVNPVYCELAGRIDIDCLLIDMEHGEVTLADLPLLLRSVAAGGSGTAVLVRPPNHEGAMLAKLADIGVDGVVVPKVDNAEQARAIAMACRYAPRGVRGLAAGSVRASCYGVDGDYRADADERLLVAVQIETRAGVDARQAIAAEPEVDMLFVGPNDLSAALGHDTQNAASAAATDELVADLLEGDKLVGTIPYHGQSRESLSAQGISLLIAGSDVAAQRAYLQSLKRESNT